MPDNKQTSTERAKQSRENRLKAGGMRLEAILDKNDKKAAEAVIRARGFKDRKEMIVTLVNEEKNRIAEKRKNAREGAGKAK